MNSKKVDLVIDLQYGSTGKGLIAGYLARSRPYDVVVNANMPNAGHTFVDKDGNKMVHRVLPNGIVGNPRYVLIGPGSVYDPSMLMSELREARRLGYGSTTEVLIHQNAVVLQDHHAEEEQALSGTIGSTAKGSMAAQIQKMRRNQRPCVAADYAHRIPGEGVRVVGHTDYLLKLSQARLILAEGAQGYSLSLNGRFWPFVTSRDCTPTRLLAEMAIPIAMVSEIIGTMRTLPIRVGGNSGPYYPDQDELKWEDLGIEPERTTVTNKVRRVFDFSWDQAREAIFECCPTSIFLNFCNYLSTIEDAEKMAHRLDVLNHMAWSGDGRPEKTVRWMGYGPRETDVVVR